MKKCIPFLLCFCLIVSLFTGFSYPVQASGLLDNGGFENGIWTLRQGGVIDTTVMHSGSQSAKLVAGTTEQYLKTDMIPVNPNGVYEVSVWIKTSGISTTDGVSVNIMMADANKQFLAWRNPLKLIKAGGTQDWTQYTAVVNSFVSGTAYIRVQLKVDANITGVAWFDDVGFQEAEPKIVNPGFEDGLWALREGGVIDTTVAHSGSQSAKIVANSTTQYLKTDMLPVNPYTVYKVSVWVKTAGISTADGVSACVMMADANKQYLAWKQPMKLIKTGGTQDWTQYTTDVSGFVTGTAYVRVMLQVDANITGTAWFDDVEFKQKVIKIGINGPTGNIFTSDEPVDLNLTMTNSAFQDKDVHVDYNVKDYNNITITTGNFDADIMAGGTFNKDLDFSSICGYGVYTLAVNVTGDNGNISTNEEFPFSKVLTSRENVQGGIYGTCTHLLGSTGGTLDKYLTLVAQAGIKWVRDDAYWSIAETVKGQINIPASWNLYADTALAKGIKPLFIIDYGNPLYDGGKAPYTDEGIAAYANYAGKLAEHFKGKIDHFEIWNEYNIGFGNPANLPPEAYEKMLKAAYTAIKTANPDAFVVGCTTSGADAEWIRRVLAAGGYDYMDAVSIHPYCYPTNPDDGGVVGSLKTINSLLNGYGPAKPVWVTEIGWPTHDINMGGVTELVSGAYAVRMYTLALSSGLADKVFWYDFQNDGISQTYNEANFGLVRSNQGQSVPWSAKANYVAYSAFTSKISGADFVKAYTVGDQVQAYRFHRNSDNKDVLVLWSKNDSKNILLKLGTSNAVSYDLFGNSSNVTAAADGTITLPVSEVPVYLEGNFSQDIEITDPYSIRVIPKLEKTSEGNQWNVNINFNNNLNTELSGKVQILDSSPWDNGSEEKPFTVAANNSATVSYEFPGNPEEKLYDLKIQITLNNGTSTVVDRKISFLAAQKAYKAPAIDGVISQDEWDGAMPISLDQASQVHMSNWGGVDDLSGKGYIKWDKDNFYFALAVKDNIHVQNGTSSDIWKGDGIQFSIDPGRKSGLTGLGYNEIGVALNSNTSSIVKWRWTAAAGVANLDNMQCMIKRNDSSGMTTYEMAIPWADLLPDGITAAPGSDFGFSMLINDNDGSGRRGWIEYMSGIGNSKNPNAFGDLLLVNMPALDSVTLSADKTILKSGETASLSVNGILEDGSQADLSKAQIVYTSDNEQVATVDGSGNVTPIGEGVASIKAFVTLYGVTKENSIQIIVDNTPPVTAAQIDGTEKNGWYSSDATITLNATDNLSGVSETVYRIGTDGDWTTYTGPVVMNQEETYTLQYRSTDKAGNLEDIKQQTVQIDKTPPAFNLIVNGNVLNDGGSFEDYLPLTFKACDNLSGVASAQISVGGSVYAIDLKTQSSIDIDLAGKAGSYTVTVIAEDNAGNRVEKNFTFTVTTSIDSMRHLIDRYVKAGELGGPLIDQLTNNLNQAQHQLDIGRPEQAAKHMEDFIKHLNNEALDNKVSADAKMVLNEDGEALIKMWSGVGR